MAAVRSAIHLSPLCRFPETPLVDGNAAVVTALLVPFTASLEQQPMHLHDAVDALGIGRRAPGLLGLAAQQGMDAAIAVGGQIGDEQPDVGDQLGIRQRWSSARSWRWSITRRRQMRAGDAERVGYRGHRTSPGNEVERKRSFFGPAARDVSVA